MDLWHIPAIDQHAHNLLKPEVFDRYPYGAAFTEGYDADIVNYHARHTLCYRRSLREIATLLECEPTEEAILSRRRELGIDRLAELCFNAANIETILLDDGFLPDEVLPGEWHQKFVTVHRVLRLEWLAENIISQVDNFETLIDHFRAAIDPPPLGVVAFKSIAAYRTGLDIQPIPYEMAKFSFYDLKHSSHQKPLRLANKALIDFLILQALEIAAKHNIPVQFHTGFGDPDLDLHKANPLYLRTLLEDSRYRNAKFVLLHASYPYMREAGYLAYVYPHVYLDFGLAVPFLSVAGMRSAVQMLLELTPTSKLMYSSDAHFIPELYYLGAKWGRNILGLVLEQSIQDSDINSDEAEAIALAVIRENARNLYRLLPSP
ncbi:amidohydrolase family protein [Microseira wollei]|uniref:Amidohydrolase 2 n=1 Tax=Microseira wollei NIES-4236 TaxID=2530354 RepID=A0AAV3WFE3_9CYAN|nr:amidohydrolase family protein [Microseira wollei]GET36504.1 amidohydrolase 2 [Microseira wollei NIES-4236]